MFCSPLCHQAILNPPWSVCAGVDFFSTRRVLLRGDGGLVTKRRHIGRVGLGLWGRGGVDMRHLGAGGGANT